MESLAQNSTLDPQLVSAKAYEIWESLGRPEGAAERTWLEAERLLRQSREQPRVATTQAQSSAPAQAEVAEPAPRVATGPSTPAKSEPPGAPNSAVQQKKPAGASKRGSRR